MTKKKKKKKVIKRSKKKKRKPIDRRDNGTFAPGTSGNPGGRKKGSKNRMSVARLYDAIEKIEADQDINVMEEFVKKAMKSPRLMIALFKKILPDLKAVEMLAGLFDSDDETAAAIQAKMKERFGVKKDKET
jgi:hypothetical protein